MSEGEDEVLHGGANVFAACAGLAPEQIDFPEGISTHRTPLPE